MMTRKQRGEPARAFCYYLSERVAGQIANMAEDRGLSRSALFEDLVEAEIKREERKAKRRGMATARG